MFSLFFTCINYTISLLPSKNQLLLFHAWFRATAQIPSKLLLITEHPYSWVAKASSKTIQNCFCIIYKAVILNKKVQWKDFLLCTLKSTWFHTLNKLHSVFRDRKSAVPEKALNNKLHSWIQLIYGYHKEFLSKWENMRIFQYYPAPVISPLADS